MTKRKAAPRIPELERFLRKYPGTDVMELLVPDLAGVLRCKRVRAHEFNKVFSDGFMPAGTVFLTRWAIRYPEFVSAPTMAIRTST
jgi:glutamine synthetase